jgi:hypothetical protein
VLGVLLAISGLELALVARDQTERVPVMIVLTTAAAILALENTATGFVIGWATAPIVQSRRNASSVT